MIITAIGKVLARLFGFAAAAAIFVGSLPFVVVGIAWEIAVQGFGLGRALVSQHIETSVHRLKARAAEWDRKS